MFSMIKEQSMSCLALKKMSKKLNEMPASLIKNINLLSYRRK